MRRKVLYVAHNHPTVRPGGAEAYALELYEAMRGSAAYEPLLVARIGDPVSIEPSAHAGAPFTVIGDDPNQYYLRTEWDGIDFFLETYRDKRLYTTYIADFLNAFLCPSNFLLERYVDWGIPREKLRFEDYGRTPQTPLPVPATDRRRTRLGFFGQMNPFKGIETLIAAMKIVAERDPDVHLYIYGANVDVLPPDQHERNMEALGHATANVTFAGPYAPGDVAHLMSQIDWVVVPSIWWENSPLVIQEAFMHGRPVICSDIGGMSEKVTHGVNGL